MSASLGAPIRVAGLDARLLAISRRGDGRHQVVSARLGGRDVVVKLYGRKRPWFPTLARSFGHRFLVAKTGLGARTRCDTEGRLLRLWREHGFAVPEVLELALPEPEPRPYLVLEQVDGRTVQAELRDSTVRLERLETGIALFAADWCRRHALAERLREPGLVHAHPSFSHLLDRAGEWVTFDLEYAYTDSRRVETLVAVEIAGFVASLLRAAGPRAAPLLRALVDAYPDHERLARVGRSAGVGRFPALDRLTAHLPRLRASGPRKNRDSVSALADALETSVRSGTPTGAAR
jgi:tRNA A-37 threonylcarbamoyl transferase component Bud32